MSKANRSPIVCLCGSTRYMQAFFAAGWQLTLDGQIVLSVGVCQHALDHGAEALGDDVVRRLDELHLRKIDLADWVLILNVGGYIGDSTWQEYCYAKDSKKVVEFLINDLERIPDPPDVDKVESWELVSMLAHDAAKGHRYF